jgi:hypothetical protein
VLLTNRVFPTDKNGATAVHWARVNFNNQVIASLDSRPVSAAAPLFKQCDARWANDLMQNATVCSVGCLMSSCSMALASRNIQLPFNQSQLGAQVLVDSNPGSLNAWLRYWNPSLVQIMLYFELLDLDLILDL